MLKDFCQKKSHVIVLYSTILSVLVVIVVYTIYCDTFSSKHYRLPDVFIKRKNFFDSPWKNVPDFDLYLRMSNWDRFVNEYKRWFVNSYKVFWPSERINSLILVLDNNSRQDHAVGKALQSMWPYPRVCYRDPANERRIYHENERKRMYWDGFYPEACTNATYVGFVDCDTVWSSLVTPNSLFENNKPVILPRIGKHSWPCWADVTEFMLGRKEIAQCMSYFPILIKVSHIIELRKFIERKHKKPFDEVYLAALNYKLTVEKIHSRDSMSQYNIMCNYLWYYHRHEYSFHMQIVPDQSWDGSELTPAMASLNYIKNIIPAGYKVPKPRIAIHGRHFYNFDGGVRKMYSGLDMQGDLGSKMLHAIIHEGLCYSGGFYYCREECRKFDFTIIYYNLYAFEFYEWLWDERCFSEQQKYLKEVADVVGYYIKTKQPVFGLNNIKDICFML